MVKRIVGRCLLVIGLTGVLTLLLLACHGYDALKKAEPNRLVVVLGNVPVSCDPISCLDGSADAVFVNVYQWVLDPAAPAEYTVCRDWTNPDDLTWDLALRPGSRFHDGRPVTAEDVAASIRTVLGDRTAVSHAFLKDVAEVSVRDPDTVRVRTRCPVNLASALGRVPVLPAGRRPDPGTVPVGSGPYRVVEWDGGRRVVLERAGGGEDEPVSGPREAVFRRVSGRDEAIRFLKTASPALGAALGRDVVALAEKEGLRVISGPGRSAWYVVCNLRPGCVTGDLAIRRAVAASIGGRSFCDRTVSKDRPLDDMVPSTVLGWRRGRYRPRKEWLTEVERPLPPLRFVSMESMAGAARILVDQLRSHGWEVRLEVLPIRETLKRLRTDGWDLSLMGFSFASGEAGQFYELAFTSGAREGTGNLGSFQDPGISRLIVEAGSSIDPRARLAKLEEIGDRLVAKLPWIPLSVTDRCAVVNGPVRLGGGFPSRWWLTRVEVGR